MNPVRLVRAIMFVTFAALALWVYQVYRLQVVMLEDAISKAKTEEVKALEVSKTEEEVRDALLNSSPLSVPAEASPELDAIYLALAEIKTGTPWELSYRENVVCRHNAQMIALDNLLDRYASEGFNDVGFIINVEKSRESMIKEAATSSYSVMTSGEEFRCKGIPESLAVEQFSALVRTQAAVGHSEYVLHAAYLKAARRDIFIIKFLLKGEAEAEDKDLFALAEKAGLPKEIIEPYLGMNIWDVMQRAKVWGFTESDLGIKTAPGDNPGAFLHTFDRSVLEYKFVL